MIASSSQPYPAGVYYHFVSWLLAAATPLLLMLTAVGLERIEAELQFAAAAAPVLPRAAVDPGGLAASANPQFHPTRRPNPV